MLECIISTLLDNNNVFLTGPGGTGKTYLLNQIIEKLESMHISIAKTASTGIAAVNINGSTMHSYFRVMLAKASAEVLASKACQNRELVHRLNNLEILIIDEISMVGLSFFTKIEHICRVVRNKDKLFGGLTLLVSGDFKQLPPVKDIELLNTQLWNSLNFNTIELSEPKRFNDISYFEMLQRVRFGKITKDDILGILKRKQAYTEYVQRVREGKESNNVKPTILYSHNKDVSLLNTQSLAKIPLPSKTYIAEDSIPDLTALDDVLPKEVELKIGAQVMLTANIEGGKYCNGHRGIVLEMKPSSVIVKLRIDANTHHEVEIGRIERETYIYKYDEKFKVTRAQIPLKLAYAMSIHRSQGSTLSFCIIDIGPKIFNKRQTYVALSRATSWDALLVKDFDVSKI